MKKKTFDLNGASHINLTLFSLRTFIFNFIAIQVLPAEDFRTWFVAIGVAFSIVALARTGILEPFLIGKFSYKEAKVYTLILIGSTAPPTFLIFLKSLDIGIPKALLMILGIELIVVSDLPRYLRFSTSSKAVFKSEIYSLFFLLLLISLLAFSQQQIEFWLIVLFQFFLIPLANLFNLSPWRQTGNSEEELKIHRPENDTKPFFAIALMSMTLTQLCIILFQNSLSTSDLRVLKSIETVLSPFRNVVNQVWTRRLINPASPNRERINLRIIYFILSLLMFPQIITIVMSMDFDNSDFKLLLLTYQIGLCISILSFNGRIYFMKGKQYLSLMLVSYWHLALSILYILNPESDYSMLILAIAHNFGLLMNTILTLFLSKALRKRI